MQNIVHSWCMILHIVGVEYCIVDVEYHIEYPPETSYCCCVACRGSVLLLTPKLARVTQYIGL